jgi:hypothetical protein
MQYCQCGISALRELSTLNLQNRKTKVLFKEQVFLLKFSFKRLVNPHYTTKTSYYCKINEIGIPTMILLDGGVTESTLPMQIEVLSNSSLLPTEVAHHSFI